MDQPGTLTQPDAVASRGRSAVVAPRIIEPRQPELRERLREAWAHRRLVLYFARRSAQKMYARTWLGLFWLPLRPAILLCTQILIFGSLLQAPSEGKPYALFFLIGFSAWEFFSRTAYFATRSLELNRRILKRMYVPRLVVFVGAIGAGLVNYVIYALIIGGFALYYFYAEGTTHFDVGFNTILTPVGLTLAILIAFSIGLWTSIYSARARDVRWTLGYVLSFWFFITPVIYPLSRLHGSYRMAAQFNPLTAPMELVRYGLLGIGSVPAIGLLVTAAVIVLVGGGGLWFFSRQEASALDNL